mmetsp:Transcript_60744/g.161372  ORF Transcript_60744/g.161372 Transcript_60744/m.161372 type:complete len:189 (+) Transcript_60744:653-1219(+)
MQARWNVVLQLAAAGNLHTELLAAHCQRCNLLVVGNLLALVVGSRLELPRALSVGIYLEMLETLLLALVAGTLQELAAGIRQELAAEILQALVAENRGFQDAVPVAFAAEKLEQNPRVQAESLEKASHLLGSVALMTCSSLVLVGNWRSLQCAALAGPHQHQEPPRNQTKELRQAVPVVGGSGAHPPR